MSAFQVGLALVRCKEHEHAAELRGTARIVLGAMAWFARDRDDPPVCVASQDDIATMAGVSVRTVHEAQQLLEQLSVIERAGAGARPKNWRPGFRFTVRWHLTLLSSAGSAEENAPPDPDGCSSADPAEEQPGVTWAGRELSHRSHRAASADPAEEQSADPAEEQSAGSAEYPSDSSRLQRRGGGRSGALASPPSAGATGGTPAPSNGPHAATAARGGSADPNAEPGKLVAEVMTARGGTAEQAEQWIKRKLNAASRPPRNEVAFIRACLANEAAAPTVKPTKKAPRKAASTRSTGEAGTSKRAAPKPHSAVLTLESNGRTVTSTAGFYSAVRPDGERAVRAGDIRLGDKVRGSDQRLWTVVATDPSR